MVVVVVAVAAVVVVAAVAVAVAAVAVAGLIRRRLALRYGLVVVGRVWDLRLVRLRFRSGSVFGLE